MKQLTGMYFCHGNKAAKNLRRRLMRRNKIQSTMIKQRGAAVLLYADKTATVLPIVFRKP